MADDGQTVAKMAQEISKLRKLLKEREIESVSKRNLEAQIQHAQKLESLGVLAGGIAHDFKNILTGIIGNAALIQMKLDSESEFKKPLKEIETAGLRASDLCKQLVAYSGKGEVVKRVQDVNEIVNETVNLLESLISKRIKIKYDLSEESLMVKVDSSQIQQLLMNLTLNASDSIGQSNGSIKVTTGLKECNHEYLRETYIDDGLAEASYVFIHIEDTGCGMDEETVSKIFDPFYSTKFKGRGLGLAAVLGIIRRHQGTIKIQSFPGEGSTFTVLIPSTESLTEDTPIVAKLEVPDSVQKSLEKEGSFPEGTDGSATVQAGLANVEQLPNLLALLENEMSIWEKLSQTLKISDIQNFAIRIEAWGAEYQYSSLKKLGEKIYAQANNFDIDGLQESMSRYPLCVKELRLSLSE